MRFENQEQVPNTFTTYLPEVFPPEFLEEDTSIAMKLAADRLAALPVAAELFEVGREAVFYLESSYPEKLEEHPEFISSRVGHTIVEVTNRVSPLRRTERQRLLIEFGKYVSEVVVFSGENAAD